MAVRIRVRLRVLDKEITHHSYGNASSKPEPFRPAGYLGSYGLKRDALIEQSIKALSPKKRPGGLTNTRLIRSWAPKSGREWEA